MPQPSAYNEQYHKDWAWSLSLKGATDEEMAEAFGISVRTLHRWKKQYPELKEAIDHGKSVADAKVKRSLYERAIGRRSTSPRTPWLSCTGLITGARGSSLSGRKSPSAEP